MGLSILDGDQLLNAKEVGAAIGANPKRVLEWARSGALPSVKVGPKFIRFAPAALRAWLDSGGSANKD